MYYLLHTHTAKALMAVFCFMFISITTTAQTISINSSFSADSEIYPFTQVDSISGLNVTGHITLYSDTSLVRMVLVDENNIKYMVYEAYPLITTSMNFDIANICDETCFLNEITPVSLIIYVHQATLTLQSITYLTQFVENADSLSYQSKRLNDTLKVQNMSSNIADKGWNWVAGHTPLVKMTYEEKTNQYGDYYNLQGFDYYIEGIYNYISQYQNERSVSNIVEHYDWRNRHGANINEAGNIYYGGPYGWITPFFDGQGSCGSCTAFGITALIESMTNLYFNRQYQLDLSEMDVWCGCSGICTTGINPSTALIYVRDNGIVNEECYKYEPPCSTTNSICSNPDIRITIDGYKTVNNYSKFDSIKSQLIRYGPLAQWLLDGNFNHEMLLIGYRYDTETNATIWIYKDNYYNFREMIISSPDVMHKTHAVTQGSNFGMHQLIGNDYDRNCRDYDQDGYYNWGVGHRIAGCGEGLPEDSDDSNPCLGPFDENYYSVPVKPIMKVEENGILIPDNSYYTFYDKNMGPGDQTILTFTITNTGNAQLNLQSNDYFPNVLLSSENDFTRTSDVILTKIPMTESTTFQITFTLNRPITEAKITTVTIQTDEIDIDDYTFTLVFSNCEQSVQTEYIQPGITNWDGSANNLKFGNVIVKAGATLYITGDYAFAQNANLYIEQGDIVNGTRLNGGIVIIDGGRLTSLCGIWPGVDVWGDKNQTQFYNLNYQGQAPLYQGLIKVINGGRISFARNAIETIKYDEFNDADPTTSGGIVYINGGIIEDCQHGVVFYPYKNFYPTPAYKQPNWSVFYKAAFNNEFVAPVDQIHFNGVNGIYIKGSSFENKYPISILPQVSWRGIYSINSGFTVTYFNLPYPSEDTIQSSFSGFNYGIYAAAEYITPENYININSSLFGDNERGIYLSAINNPRIAQNEFLVRKDASIFDALNIPTEMIGLYLDNLTTGFTVEENNFYSTVGYTDLKEYDCAGITVNNTGQNYNELYNNYFNNLTVGIAAGGTNRDELSDDGLCIKCNDFTNTITDVYVKTAEEPVGNKQGIAYYQGDEAPVPPYGEPFEPTYAAGNTFSIKTDLTYANYANDVYCYPIRYTHHQQSNIKVIPDPTDPVQPTTYIDLYLDGNVSYESKETACPSNFNGGGIDILAQKSLLETESFDVLAYLDTLDMTIDGGNTTSLNLDVTTSSPNDALELRQQLLDESPFLSDTVMNSAIYKENVLPNAMLRDVLVANPQSAKSPDVMQTINIRNISMPDYMMAEIMQGAAIEGGKDALSTKLSKHKSKRDRAMKKLIDHYISDTLDMASSHDSIINLLQNSQYLYPRYQLAALYLNNRDSSNAFNTLNNIEIDFQLSVDDENAHELFVELAEIQWELIRDSKAADSLQISELFNIAADINTMAGVLARNMLVSVGETEYHEPVYFPEYLKAKPIFGYNGDIANKKPSFIKVFPNPAADYFIVETKINQDFNEAFLKLVAMEGVEIKRVELRKKCNQVMIPLGNISSGTYILQLVVNSKVIDSEKVIITK